MLRKSFLPLVSVVTLLPSVLAQAAVWGQCTSYRWVNKCPQRLKSVLGGGTGYTGPTTCVAGFVNVTLFIVKLLIGYLDRRAPSLTSGTANASHRHLEALPRLEVRQSNPQRQVRDQLQLRMWRQTTGSVCEWIPILIWITYDFFSVAETHTAKPASISQEPSLTLPTQLEILIFQDGVQQVAQIGLDTWRLITTSLCCSPTTLHMGVQLLMQPWWHLTSPPFSVWLTRSTNSWALSQASQLLRLGRAPILYSPSGSALMILETATTNLALVMREFILSESMENPLLLTPLPLVSLTHYWTHILRLCKNWYV